VKIVFENLKKQFAETIFFSRHLEVDDERKNFISDTPVLGGLDRISTLFLGFHLFRKYPYYQDLLKNYGISWIFSKYPYYQDLLKIMKFHEITACFLLIYWEDLTVFLDFSWDFTFSANILITRIY
jgi:hypothetical protein